MPGLRPCSSVPSSRNRACREGRTAAYHYGRTSMREITTLTLEGRGLRQRLARLRPRAVGGAWIATGKSIAGLARGVELAIVLTGWVLVPILPLAGCCDHARPAVRAPLSREPGAGDAPHPRDLARARAVADARAQARARRAAATSAYRRVLHPLRQLLPVPQLRVPAHRRARQFELPHLRRAPVEAAHLWRVSGGCLRDRAVRLPELHRLAGYGRVHASRNPGGACRLLLPAATPS